MGINASKLTQRATSKNSVEDKKTSLPSTPILTPKVFRENIEKESLDPRSPSRNIARTPIEVLTAVLDKLEALTIETGESDKAAVETPLKRHLILGIDPRSPTLQILRTPIVVSSSPDKKLPATIRNKNLDKVRNSALLDKPTAASPKLLGSNPVTPKIKSDAYKRKSLVLLETNIDYTETDLDTVISEKYLGNLLQNSSIPIEAPYSEVSDPRSPTIDFLRTPIQVCGTITDNLTSESADTKEHLVQNVDSNIGSVKESVAEQDSVDTEEPLSLISDECLENDDLVTEGYEPKQGNSVCSQEYCNEFIEGDSFDSNNSRSEKNIVHIQTEIPEDKFQMLPKSAPVSPPSIVDVTAKVCKSEPITPPTVDIKADVKELEKKLINLIYEDDDLVVCPRIVKIKDQNRTPLGPKNSRDDNKMHKQKLKVSDKPRTSTYVVSRIPVFKEKKIKVQCENTPPRGMKDHRSKKSQWDPKDDTLVI